MAVSVLQRRSRSIDTPSDGSNCSDGQEQELRVNQKNERSGVVIFAGGVEDGDGETVKSKSGAGTKAMFTNLTY